MAGDGGYRVRLSGDYHWSLIWSCDNSSNSEAQSFRTTIKNFVSFSASQLRESVRTVDQNVTFSREAGASAVIKAIKVHDNTKFGLAKRVYHSQQLKDSWQGEETRSVEVHRDFVCGAHSTLQVYVLKLASPGVVATAEDIIAEIPIGGTLPDCGQLRIDIEIRLPLYSWIWVQSGEPLPTDVFKCDTALPLCRAEYGTLRPGFVNAGRAEVCYGDSRHLVDRYEVLVLKSNATAKYIDNDHPFVDEHHSPPDTLKVGPQAHPVCRAMHETLRPAFVNGPAAEVAYGSSRHLHNSWQWVCIVEK